MSLSSVCQAQDTTTFMWFKTEFMNTTVVTNYGIQDYHDPVLKPAFILLGTFAINQAVILINEKHGNHEYTNIITGTVFLVGVTTSIIVFSREIKKRNLKY